MQISAFGTWKSPISSELIVADTLALGEIALDGDTIYWIEGRPKEAGRYVIMGRRASGEVRELTPPGFNARTRVHEYGGGAFLVAEGEIVFSNFADQRLYRQTWDSEPVPLTPESPWRYADGIFDAQRRQIICVREDHTEPDQEAVNTLVSIPWDNSEGEQKVLVSGHDFVSSPRLSPDGRLLAWLTWDHPRMPWDGTELWVAELRNDGTLEKFRKVAGGESESIFQPEWSPDGELYFISDRSGWWNLYRCDIDKSQNAFPVCPREAEFGVPQWVFGLSTYGFESASSIICTFLDRDGHHLARLGIETGEVVPFETPFSSYRFVRVGTDRVVFLGGSPVAPTALAELDLSSGTTQVHKRSGSVTVDAGYLSVPEAIELPT
ncbi:MAG: PD40 domain-containing protein, partial [Planctomycetaceae bacterium]|nr:PD40 domain-containing protein [Planctomycetaceae bacterium]